MKTAVIFAAAVLVVGGTFVGAVEGRNTAQTQTIETCTFKVTGMTCAGCEAAVRIAAKSVSGVTDAKASYANGNADITFDSSKTSPAAIAKAITDRSGFKAEVVQKAAKK